MPVHFYITLDIHDTLGIFFVALEAEEFFSWPIALFVPQLSFCLLATKAIHQKQIATIAKKTLFNFSLSLFLTFFELIGN